MIRRTAAILLGLSLSLMAAACTRGGTQVPGPASPAPTPSAVAVVTGDIVSVVTVDGVVQPTPDYVVWAVSTSPVRPAQGIKANGKVAAGQVIGRQGSAELKAPVAGFFVQWLVPTGVAVHRNVPVAVLRYGGFGVSAAVPPELAYRVYDGPLSARAHITNGPGPFPCQLLPVSGGNAASAQTTPEVRVLCAVPRDVQAFAGLKALVGVRTAEREGVLLVPATAVSATNGKGVVWKVVDGDVKEVGVTVGVTDGVNIEIVDGLAEGDTVLPYGPGLRMAGQ